MVLRLDSSPRNPEVVVRNSAAVERWRGLIGVLLLAILAIGAATEPANAQETTLADRGVIVGLGDGEQAVIAQSGTTAGSTLGVRVFLDAPVPGLFAVVRPLDGSHALAQHRLPSDPVGTSIDVSLELDLPIGRYLLWPCVGFYVETCTELGVGLPFEVISGELRALMPGHNRASAERINVVFVGSGVGAGGVAPLALDLLMLDGPINVGTDLLYGPMAIEPLASNHDKFNFWFLDHQLTSEIGLFEHPDPAAVVAALGLPNIQLTVLYASADGPSDARMTSFFGDRELPAIDGLRFGGVRLSVDLEAPLWAAPTLAHEWGHGLFALRDEYSAPDERPALTRYPNCAPDLSTAQRWWGHLLGHVDPFVYDVLRARTDAGLPVDTFDQPLPELVRVGMVPGGCYGAADDAVAFRPSFDSLMNNELPVFGSVNRARVEDVLEHFSGRGELDDLDDLILSCTSRLQQMTCEGRLRSYFDPPSSGLMVGGRQCQFATDDEPIVVTCAGPVPAGGFATIAAGLQRDRVEVTNLDPPPTDKPASGGPAQDAKHARGTPLTDDGEETGSIVRFWGILAATTVTAGGLAGRARRVRY
ncbi:MAG: hypothetical protein ACI8TP_000081 [Acidimicrobiales bacterium]|jgi:hypothetical protein